MNPLFAIVLCLLSVFGLYAIFARISVALMPKRMCRLTLEGEGVDAEELLARARCASLLAERLDCVDGRVAVLLKRRDERKEITLRKEGILIYIVDSEENEDGR